MPELPDITVYVERLREMLSGQALSRIRLSSPFLLRSVVPPLSEFEGKAVTDVIRRGKRIVFGFAGGLRLSLHLMIAGRLHWKAAGAPIPKGNGLMAMDFPSGTLILTESGTKKRAALLAFPDQASLQARFPVGLEPLEADPAAFAAMLRSENHTLKQTFMDPSSIYDDLGFLPAYVGVDLL
jgi:formamidopyrimidine-DNA glycosylase